jgi:hypothetical protein
MEPNTFTEVAFFEFANSTDAGAFYAQPPIEARLNLSPILGYAPLIGDTGVAGPAHGLDLRSCLWAGQTDEGPYGSTAAGQLLASGQCTLGHPSSIGVGTIIQRGSVVVLVENTTTTNVDGLASATDLSKNTRLAHAALQLLHSVGLAS